jgi:ribosomal protein S18 acetylase RimI-like enzyme
MRTGSALCQPQFAGPFFVGGRTPMQIRRASASDAAILSELATATFPLACPPHTTLAAIADFIGRNFTVANFDSYLADRALFLAFDDGAFDDGSFDDGSFDDGAVDDAAAIGYAMLVIREPIDPDVISSLTMHPTAELSKLYVRPGHHGAGVSAALVAACVEAATAAGCAAMWLGVNEENARANGFYEKSGFVRVGVKKFQVGERFEDDFVRERAL